MPKIRRGEPSVLGDFVRAIFVAVDAFLAVALGAVFIAGAIQLTAPAPATEPDTVVPRIDLGDVMLLGFTAAGAGLALWQAVRLWLRASWHVVTVTLAVCLAMPIAAYAWLLMNGMGQH